MTTMRTFSIAIHRLLMLCVCLACSLPAWADGVVLTESGDDEESTSGRRYTPAEAGVMVRPFSGPKAEQVQQAVIQALESAGVILIPAGFEEDVKLAEQPGPYVQVANRVGIKAYVHGKTSMSKKGWSLALRVRNGKDGRVVAEPTLSAGWLPGLLKKIDVEAMGVLEGPLSRTSLPPTALKGGSVDAADDGAIEEVTLVADGDLGSAGPLDEPPPKTGRNRDAAPSPLDASVGVGGIQRTLQYNKAVGDVYENGLQPHQIAAPALHLDVRWYPGAHLLDGPLAHVGLTFEVYRTLLGQTTVSDTMDPLPTSFTELNLGLRGRIPLPSNVELGLNGGWGWSATVLQNDNEAVAGQQRNDPGVVPDVEYTYFRFGPDVSFEFGAPIRAGVFYRTLTLGSEDGYFGEDRWFPNAAGIGLEAYLTFGIELTDELDLELGGVARYYGIDANSGSFEDTVDPTGNAYLPGQPGLNQAVAAGASDAYLGVLVRAHYTLPGR